MPVVLPADVSRHDFMEGMKSRGIQTSIHYPPIHTFSAYRDFIPSLEGILHWTEEAGSREVTLPLYPGMSEADVNLVVESVAQSLNLQIS